MLRKKVFLYVSFVKSVQFVCAIIDSIHSRNIITKFYPSVSKQVVIFPLLGKELSEDEYNALLPNVNKVYIIENEEGCSSFRKVTPNKLFETLS